MRLFNYRNLLSVLILSCSSLVHAEQELDLNLMNNSPAALFTDQDWTLLKEQARKVLNNEESDFSGFWKNPESGHSGSVKSIGEIVKNKNTQCRDLQFINETSNSVTTTKTTVCKQNDGQWQELIGRQSVTDDAGQYQSEDMSSKSVLFTDQTESAEISSKVLSETPDHCVELADKIEEYEGQILRQSAARERYEAECLR